MSADRPFCPSLLACAGAFGAGAWMLNPWPEFRPATVGLTLVLFWLPALRLPGRTAERVGQGVITLLVGALASLYWPFLPSHLVPAVPLAHAGLIVAVTLASIPEPLVFRILAVGLGLFLPAEIAAFWLDPERAFGATGLLPTLVATGLLALGESLALRPGDAASQRRDGLLALLGLTLFALFAQPAGDARQGLLGAILLALAIGAGEAGGGSGPHRARRRAPLRSLAGLTVLCVVVALLLHTAFRGGLPLLHASLERLSRERVAESASTPRADPPLSAALQQPEDTWPEVSRQVPPGRLAEATPRPDRTAPASTSRVGAPDRSRPGAREPNASTPPPLPPVPNRSIALDPPTRPPPEAPDPAHNPAQDSAPPGPDAVPRPSATPAIRAEATPPPLPALRIPPREKETPIVLPPLPTIPAADRDLAAADPSTTTADRSVPDAATSAKAPREASLPPAEEAKAPDPAMSASNETIEVDWDPLDLIEPKPEPRHTMASSVVYGDDDTYTTAAVRIGSLRAPPGVRPPEAVYLRIHTLEKLTARGFRLLNPPPGSLVTRSPHALPTGFTRPAARVPQWWELRLADGASAWLPLPGEFAALRLTAPTDLLWSPRQFGIRQREWSWQVEVAFDHPDFDARVPLLSDPADPATLELFGEPALDASLRALSAEIAGRRALTPARFAERAVDFLQRRSAYSVSARVEEGAGPVLFRWLMQGQDGYCEHFAGAFALLARARGIPARVVTGYLLLEFEKPERRYPIASTDAHAWVEVLDGDTWLRIDPTPPQLRGRLRLDDPLEDGPRWATDVVREETEDLNALPEAYDTPAAPPPLDDSAAAEAVAAAPAGLSDPPPPAVVASVATARAVRASPEEPTPPPSRPASTPPARSADSTAVTAGPAPASRTAAPAPAAAEPVRLPAATASPVPSEQNAGPDPRFWTILGVVLLAAVLVTWSGVRATRRRLERRATATRAGHDLRLRTAVGRLLAEVEAQPRESGEGDPRWRELHRELLRLRYGPALSRDDWQRVRHTWRNLRHPAP